MTTQYHTTPHGRHVVLTFVESTPLVREMEKHMNAVLGGEGVAFGKILLVDDGSIVLTVFMSLQLLGLGQSIAS
jgi:hypothetical protein